MRVIANFLKNLTVDLHLYYGVTSNEGYIPIPYLLGNVSSGQGLFLMEFLYYPINVHIDQRMACNKKYVKKLQYC